MPKRRVGRGGDGCTTARSTASRFCFASTTVAAIYHVLFGWIAPYAYTSVPVVLGTLGGLGLLIGPAGLFLVDRGRDPDLSDAAERSLGGPFLALLFLTSLTGLAPARAARATATCPCYWSMHLAHRAGAVRHAALRQVRARNLSSGGAGESSGGRIETN